MVATVSSEITLLPANPLIGRQMMDVICAGMYNNPLMVLREYVQNSVDAIDVAISKDEIPIAKHRVGIEINAESRQIRISDTGSGVPRADVMQVLCSIGVSAKDPRRERGFRGIGRFGGLGYADRLIFETRSNSGEDVSIVVWDAFKLSEYIQARGTLTVDTLIKAVTTHTSRRGTPDEPPHFFNVIMDGVRRFHSDELMDVKKVRDYVSQVAPVPYDKATFSFTSEIENHFGIMSGFKVYDITVNGQNVTRPYKDSFATSAVQTDKIKKINCFDILDEQDSILARGWFAETGYRSSLPPSVLMRGIRVRQGNIEIGDEYFLADCFTERRFATWHIGEIHLASRIRPNARRDGFEQNQYYERFLEHSKLLGKHLSGLCRESSKQRSTMANRMSRLQSVENELANIHFFANPEHFEKIARGISSNLANLENNLEIVDSDPDYSMRIEKCRQILRGKMVKPSYLHDILDARSLRSVDPRELLTRIYSKLIATDELSTKTTQSLFESLQPYFKTR